MNTFVLFMNTFVLRMNTFVLCMNTFQPAEQTTLTKVKTDVPTPMNTERAWNGLNPVAAADASCTFVYCQHYKHDA
jgi:hypothetical protein